MENKRFFLKNMHRMKRSKGRKRETIDILKYNSLEFAIIYILKISNLN